MNTFNRVERTQPQEVAASERSGSIRPVIGGLFLGTALAVVWSFEFVDDTIGDNVANTVLGHDAGNTAIASSTAGALFALVIGLAGTFTACNIAVFGALPQVAVGSGERRGRLGAMAIALGYLVFGMLTVSATYGVIAVLAGDRIPQLSNRVTAGGVPERLLQSAVVFGVVGLAFAYLGLASLRLVPDVFAGRPRARLWTIGALIGGFLVGRPYPLFQQLAEYAVERHNPLYGAVTFALQSLGNVLVVAVIAVLLAASVRWASVRWLLADDRAAEVAGVALLTLGTFLVMYWDIRLPAMFGYGWFPIMPWN